jgi:small subunit ribosomal protein S7
MARHNKPKKRNISTDPVYDNKLLTRFINKVMKSGKKTVAQNNVYGAFEIIKEKKLEPLEVFLQAIQNVGPKMEVRPRRIGGASYQVPVEVRGERRLSLAIRWLIQSANARPNKQFHTFKEKLAAELLDAYNNIGEAIRKRDLMHRNAEANRAFSHFRW